MTAALFVFVAFRVLLAVRMNTDTALAVVSTSGVVEVALGIAISSYWMVLLIVYAMSDAWRRIANRRGDRSTDTLLLQFITGFVALLFAPFWGVVLVVGLTILFGHVERLLERKRGLAEEPWIVTFTLFLVAFVIGQSVWLPTEVIITNERDDAIIGYVLDADSEWISVLRDDDRYVERLRSESVVYRALCTLPEGRPGFALIQAIQEPTFVFPCEAVPTREELLEEDADQ